MRTPVMPQARSRPKNRSRGFVFLVVVVSAAALLSFVGLSIDVGYLQLIKCRMQTAADAAALGGVQERKQNGAAHIVDAAKSDASLNGFTAGQNTVIVTVNVPPASGFYMNDPTAVEVLLAQDVHTMFMGVLGFTSVTVRARSVARQGSSSNCIYLLDPSAAKAFAISGGATLDVGCGIMVNSSSSNGFNAAGGAQVNAASISVTGGYQIGGGVTLNPTPTTGVAPQSDPLAYVPAPIDRVCWQNGWSIGNGAPTKTINGGVYCGGITLNGGTTVIMSAGTYILVGGGLNVGNGSKITGSGVTIFLTSDATHPYLGVTLNGGAILQLSAPTTGPLAGILFFQDRTIAAPSASSFSNGVSLVFDGALYFPTSAVSYSGGATSNYTILVAKSIAFSGGTKVNSNYASLPAGSPVKGNAALSE